MKRLLSLILVVGLLWASPGFSAECTGGVETRRINSNGSGVLSVLVTSDGSACTVTLGNDTNYYIDDFKGALIYALEVVPGTASVAPDAAFDIDLENANAFHLLDTNSNSNTATTWNLGDATLGDYPPVRCASSNCSGDLVLEMGDMGTAGDQATIHIHFRDVR